MLKEIANQEQKHMDYQKNAEKQYGTRYQLNKELSKFIELLFKMLYSLQVMRQ